MKHARWLAAVLAGLCALSDLRSQVPLFPPAGAEFSFGGRGRGRHHSVSAFVSGSFGYGYYPFYPPIGVPFTRVTFLNFSSPTVVVNSPPVVVAPVVQVGPVNVAPVQVVGRDDQDEEAMVVPRRRQPVLDGEDARFDVFRPRPRRPLDEQPGMEQPEIKQPMMPGAPASVYRPVGPGDRRRTSRPEQSPPFESRPEKKPAPRPRPPEETLDEYARQLKQGTDALGRQEYARAERLFRQAAVIDAAAPRGYFLLAQAQFALAKYQEAAASIQAGMRLQPDWPLALFRPRMLYGPNGADYDDQLKRLREALAKFPQDPVLLFLLAYQLWFDGRQDEARPLFERARPLAPDKTLIDRFLQAGPAQPLAASR